MKNRIVILLFVLGLIHLAGCQTDPILDFEEEQQLELFFSTPEQVSSLKSTAIPTESLINDVILFGVDDQDNVVQTIVITNPLSGGISRTVLRKVITFYAIANPTPSIKTSNPVSVSDLMNMTVDFTTAPMSPFLMSGKGDVNGDRVNFELVRIAAKIELIAKNGFQITSVTIKNTPDKGYVFNKGQVSVPTASRVNYAAVNSATLYVAENNMQNPTQFVVIGQYGSQQVNHTFEIKKNGQVVDILRNSHYQIDINPTIQPDPYKNGIKILAIGNSYSEDAFCYLFPLLKQLGVNESNTKLVVAYISGGSLNNHASNVRNNRYTNLRREIASVNGGLSSASGYTLQQLIKEEAWDVITLQQNSDNSGNAATYNADLDFLIDYVKTNATNPNFKLGWHMTWAWASNYSNYRNVYGNQVNMYNQICNAVQTKIVPNSAFSIIIPSGTAIQNARVPFGDVLNHDGTHLSNLGCYIAAATWIKTITGYDVSKLTTPYTANKTWGGATATINTTNLPDIVQAVNAAVAYPFQSP